MTPSTTAAPSPNWDQGTQTEEVLIGNPNFQFVALADLFIDEYQRRWSQEQSDRIAREFSMEAFGNLHVVKRGEHSYEVIDGQHRLMALRRMGYDLVKTKVICQVFEATGDYAPNAPAIFVGLNTNRRPLKPVERLVARIHAKEPQALTLKKLVDEVGLELWAGTGRVPEGHIGAIATLEGLMKRDGYDATKDLLDRIKSYWGGDPRAWKQPIIVGLRHFLRHYRGRVNDAHLHQVLTENDPGSLTRRGQAITEALSGGQLEYGVARAISALYNENAKGAEVRRLSAWDVGRTTIRNVPKDELREKASKQQRQGGTFLVREEQLAETELPRPQ